MALAALGRDNESRASLEAGLRELERVLPPGHPRVQEARRLTGGR